MSRIVYLWDADYPWDVRTEKICLALRDADHEVHIVARNRAWRVIEEHLPEGVVHRMTPWKALGAPIDRRFGFPAFFNPRWASHLARTIRRVQADLIIARDLPLCPTAIWIGKRTNVPVLFDMAENYPALLKDVWDTRQQNAFDFLVRNPVAARTVERYCLPRVTRILVVVEESRDRLVGMGIPAERIDVVSNTPSLSRLDVGPNHRTKRIQKGLEVVYLGLMEVARGVGLLVEAAHRLRTASSPVRLRLIGGGRDLEHFREQARRLGVLDCEVEFAGFIPSHQDALAMVAKADVGAIPHLPNEWANTTIPNKLFDYMAAGLAVLTSDAIPCARIIRETGAGDVFHAPDVEDLVAALLRLVDPEVRAAKGQSGIRAIRERYNWQADIGVLLNAVESTIGEFNATGTS